MATAVFAFALAVWADRRSHSDPSAEEAGLDDQ
jgi:hypothetical protein